MSELTVWLKADDTLLREKEATWTDRVAKLNDELSRTEQHLLTVTRRVWSAITSTISTIRSMLRAFGAALPAAWEAIISAIQSTIMSLTAMAIAYTAGGVTAYLAVPLEAAAIMLTFVSLALALQGQTEAAQKLDQAEMAIRSLGQTTTSWGRVFGAWE